MENLLSLILKVFVNLLAFLMTTFFYFLYPFALVIIKNKINKNVAWPDPIGNSIICLNILFPSLKKQLFS